MKQNEYHQYAWLFVFIPALLYYLFVFSLRLDSRWGFLSSLELAQPFLIIGTKGRVAHHTVLKQVESILYIKNDFITNVTDNSRVIIPSSTINTTFYSLNYPMESVIRATDSISYNFHSLIWRHDPDLGRGYLLISDASNAGRIWRWEVGSGPITIGRSLFIEKSGCRSGIWNPCPTTNDESDWLERSILKYLFKRNYVSHESDYETTIYPQTHVPLLGSSGLALQPSDPHKNYFIGLLLVAELGEKRIVRIEEGNARTPIVIQVPSLCLDSNQTKRLNVPGILATTPAGHLLFTDYSTCDEDKPIMGVYRVMDISKIPPLPTHLNRESHAWTTFNQSYSDRSASYPKRDLRPEYKIDFIFFKNMSRVSGVAISKDMQAFALVGGYLITATGEIKYVIYKVPLHESTNDLNNIFDDDDDDDKEELPNVNVQCNNTMDMSCDSNTTDYDEQMSKVKGLYDDEALLFIDMTDFFQGVSETDAMNIGPAITVDSLGNVYATFPGGILILNNGGKIITSILIDEQVTDRIPTSIALGLGDGYLYLSTKTSLLRLRIKTKPSLHAVRGKQK